MIQIAHFRFVNKRDKTLIATGGATAVYNLFVRNDEAGVPTVYAKVALAKCDDRDVYCRKTGRTIATERFLGNIYPFVWEYAFGTVEALQATVDTTKHDKVIIGNKDFKYGERLSAYVRKTLHVDIPDIKRKEREAAALAHVPDPIEDRVCNVIRTECLLAPDHVLTHEQELEEFFSDSLDRVELMMAFEDEFSIQIPDDKAETLSTVGEVIEYIANYNH